MIEIVETSNCIVQLWLGLKEGYEGPQHTVEEVIEACKEHCDSEQGDCITITETTYLYKKGQEKGVVIGWITYPRFFKTEEELVKRAIELGSRLVQHFKQYRASVTTANKTFMLSNV